MIIMIRALSLFAVASVLAGCSTTGSGSKTNAVTGTMWYISKIGTTQLTKASATEVPHLQFTTENVSGFTGCNRLSGAVTIDGPALTFGPMASTKMMCEQAPLENRILKALSAVRSYTINATSLYLLGATPADTLITCTSQQVE